MTLTIITVTYNCISTIEQTIASVLSQKNVDVEYIVIDGDSNDGTAEVIEKYVDRLAFFVSEKDAGVYDAMNKGINRASGDYILFLNGDDYLVDENAVNRIATHLDGSSIVVGRVRTGSRISEVVDMDKAQSPYFGIFYPHQATIIPRGLFKELGLYDLSYKISADFDWICKAIYNGNPVKWVDEIVSVFRTGGMSSRLECSIDEYNISRKYLDMAGDEKLISVMTETAVDTAKNRIFTAMLCDVEFKEIFKDYISKLPSSPDSVQLWGGGFLAEYYIGMFRLIGVNVSEVIDKNAGEGRYISKIHVVTPSDRNDDLIFISSEYYDDDIAKALIDDGENEGKTFIRHRKFRNDLIKATYGNNKYVQKFEKETGLSLN